VFPSRRALAPVLRHRGGAPGRASALAHGRPAPAHWRDFRAEAFRAGCGHRLWRMGGPLQGGWLRLKKTLAISGTPVPACGYSRGICCPTVPRVCRVILPMRADEAR
jgi:hypothetical protein